MIDAKILPIENLKPTEWYWIKGGLSDIEIEKIYTKTNSLSLEASTILTGSETNIRKSLVSWLLKEDKENDWLYDKLIDFAYYVNKELWNFDINFLVDDIQYSQYLSDSNHYDYHLDLGPGMLSLRKISIVVQLSDSNDYEGGDLQILKGKNPINLPRDKGSVFLFPSFLLHRVTPVTSGQRDSLVLWLCGKSFS